MSVKIIALLLLSVLVGLSIVSVVCAQTPALSASVSAKDNPAGTGQTISECSIGTTLWLFWTQAPSGTTIEIKVYAPDGALIHDVSGLQQSDSGTDQLKFTITQSGIYYAVVIGANNAVIGSNYIASETVLVTPENPIGSIATGTATFGAIGVFYIFVVKRKRSVIPSS